MRTVAIVLSLCSLAALAQPARPAFEVASIKPGQNGGLSIDTGPTSLTMRAIRLKSCIAWAFDIQDPQIVGPGWLNEVTYDIMAKSSNRVTEAELRAMLQTLLADRFQLTAHQETREVPALVLVINSKGHKLKPTDTPGEPSFSTGKMSLTGHGATVAQMTQFLSRALGEPVIDQTGLKGLFNYTLDINAYVTDEMRKSSGPPLEANSIIAEAMQAQLGLKVEAKKTPVPLLIVDHLERVPAEN